jgi:hypothetical protein
LNHGNIAHNGNGILKLRFPIAWTAASPIGIQPFGLRTKLSSDDATEYPALLLLVLLQRYGDDGANDSTWNHAGYSFRSATSRL